MMQLVQGTDPCLSYQSGTQICTQCPTGYTLLLWTNTSTICATASSDLTTCTIDSTQYPTQAALANGIVFNYYSGNGIPYCFNCERYYSRALSSTSTSETQLCSSCLQSDFSSNFFLQSIYSLSQGCTNCLVSTASHQNISYLSQAKLFMRECNAPIPKQVASCTFSQFYSFKLATCLECNSVFPNCAACNSTKCIMCPVGYYQHPSILDYSSSTYKQTCIFGVCPLGFCKNDITNQCVTSTLGLGCQICRVNSDSSQSCDICASGYQISQTTGLCTKPASAWNKALFVKGNAQIDPTKQIYSPTATGLGLDVSLPFLFIQEAINSIIDIQASGLYSPMKANIYLGKGNHSFF